MVEGLQPAQFAMLLKQAPTMGQTGAFAIHAFGPFHFEYIYDEARKRYEAGMPVFEAAKDIPLDRYASWSDGERIVVNVAMIYRELSGDQSHPDTVSLFAQMAPLAAL